MEEIPFDNREQSKGFINKFIRQLSKQPPH